jgi:hypothetical protein
MKKSLIIAAIAAFTTVSSYGQGGYIDFQGFLHNVANNWTTPGTISYTTGIDVELFYAPSGTTSPFSNIASSSSPASLAYDPATAWDDITGQSAFQAVDGSGGAGTVAMFSDSATGGGAYNGAAAYKAGNLVGGTTYSFLEVAWWTGYSGQYTTLAEAAAADSYVGWSQVFSYNALTSGNPAPRVFTGSLVGNYDVGGVPEPSTLALAGLGGLALLVFRRRK